MKRIVVEAVVVSIFIYAIVQIGTGCAALGKVGDGKLEPVTKGAAKAALTAGAVAAPEYAAILKRIQSQIEDYGQTEAQADPLSGYAFTRTYFYDGSPVPDPSRITWVDKWERTESAGKATPPTSKTNSATADDADDALAAAIAELLAGEE